MLCSECYCRIRWKLSEGYFGRLEYALCKFRVLHHLHFHNLDANKLLHISASLYSQADAVHLLFFFQAEEICNNLRS